MNPIVKKYYKKIGKIGGKTTLEKYGKEQLKKWGKLGGRPKLPVDKSTI